MILPEILRPELLISGRYSVILGGKSGTTFSLENFILPESSSVLLLLRSSCL